MSNGTKESDQKIAWNDIQLHCPPTWQTIISGERHLLFEEDFHPIMELRWQKMTCQSPSDREGILTNLTADSDLEALVPQPPSWKELEGRYAIRMLGTSATGPVEAAILVCRQCGTTLLLSFFEDPARHYRPLLPRIVASISCHAQDNKGTRLWAIQDFQITIPHDFQLQGHNFGAGLTRLSFRNRGLTMHLCRLAGAANKLQDRSMLELLNLMGDLAITTVEAHTQGSSVGHSSSPSLLQQIRLRLKGTRPFYWVILRHHPELDRLSGLFFFDKKPISEQLTTSILDSYELFAL